jgi:alkanesulfonate monooxygenase SsuD/methylene tetrahydromethanopterin reductase-like flavin-dependent oxidoreductase (luciferase family)
MAGGRPLKVGVQLPEVERVVRWPELRSMAEAAEAVGLDSIWVGDHLLYRDAVRGSRGPWEVWTTLAALATVTNRVEIGPLVAATSFHSPAMLAKMASTVEEISGGRLILGLGAGWNEVEYRAFGFDFDQRISRFEEAFTIIRTLLREGSIDFDGRYYQARDCELLPRSVRPGGPPLLIGSSGPRMLRITMPHAEAWNAWYSAYGNRADGLAPLIGVVDEACREVGRDPSQVTRTVAAMVKMPGYTGARDFDRKSAPPLPGDPDELAATLRDFAAAGISHVQLVIDPITVASLEGLGTMLQRLDA